VNSLSGLPCPNICFIISITTDPMKRTIAFLMLILLSGITLQSRAQGEKSFADGVKKFYERNYTAAIELFNTAIDSNPKYIRAYNARALAYRNMKDYDKALADYSKIISLSPNDTLAYSDRGITYGFMKQYDKAIIDFTKRIELDPHNPKAYLARGNAYFQLKNYDMSIKDFKAAVEANPKMGVCYRYLGLAECVSGDTVSGCGHFNKAKELNFPAVQKLIDQYCTKKP